MANASAKRAEIVMRYWTAITVYALFSAPPAFAAGGGAIAWDRETGNTVQAGTKRRQNGLWKLPPSHLAKRIRELLTAPLRRLIVISEAIQLKTVQLAGLPDFEETWCGFYSELIFFGGT